MYETKRNVAYVQIPVQRTNCHTKY